MTIRGIPDAVLVAPDSFKGTFSAIRVAGAIAAGLRAGDQDAIELPVADGGEGTLGVLAAPLGLELVEVDASDALGRPIRASIGLAHGTAVVETAAAIGLGLVVDADRDAVAASSRGAGELIAGAAAAGAREIIVAVGGSASTDGGAGAVAAIDEAGGLGGARLTVLCDVRTMFVDAATVFGPQKGADAAQVEQLRHRLAAIGETYADRYSRDPRGVLRTGAAGGLAGGLWAACGAALVAGAPYVLDAVGFDAQMRAARLVITGEGRLDQQTLAGKLVGELATRARQAGVPCGAVVGRDALDPFGRRILDLDPVIEAGTLVELERAGRALAARVVGDLE